jgi:enoyl-CoA hydratase/carnithine racemase
VTYQHILYEVSEKIATITLNRPDRMNAWTPVMERDVRHAMETAAADDDVRVIVLTGSGRAFCAGADMDALKGLDPNDIRRAESVPPFDMNRRPDWQTRYGFYPSIPKPVIAMLNGATAGIGLVHALYCDLRFAADNTVFTTAFSRRGLIAEHGISWMLPRIVGHANALDLLMSARRVQSDEALRIGLVNRLYSPDQLREQTYAYARDLAEMVSPSAIAVIKRQLTTYRSRPWPKPPSTPTARWSWRCAAAISARAWRALWRSGHRGLRGSRFVSLYSPPSPKRAMAGQPSLTSLR